MAAEAVAFINMVEKRGESKEPFSIDINRACGLFVSSEIEKLTKSEAIKGILYLFL